MHGYKALLVLILACQGDGTHHTRWAADPLDCHNDTRAVDLTSHVATSHPHPSQHPVLLEENEQVDNCIAAAWNGYCSP